MEVCGQLQASPVLTPGKEIQLYYRRLVEPHNWRGYFEEESSDVAGNRISDGPDRRLVTILTELFGLIEYLLVRSTSSYVFRCCDISL